MLSFCSFDKEHFATHHEALGEIEKFKNVPKAYERYLADKAAGKNFLADFAMDN